MTTLHLAGLTATAPSGAKILDDVGFEVRSGEIVGLVGESGSGKSMTSLALTGLLPGAITPVAGTASLDGDVFMTDGRVVARPPISIVFQNAKAALNPTMRIGNQFTRLLTHLGRRPGTALTSEIEGLLEQVGIVDPKRVSRAYPNQLSGGMNQRVMIALALASEPKVLIADEPTTGLDVTVQAQILQLLKTTTANSNRGVLLITHDLGVVAQMCSRVVVMLKGRIVEINDVDAIFHGADHPYTRELVAAAEGTGTTKGAHA
ncbi:MULTISPECIES: ABC transporter ATP-binding protein [unclassified Microbacterium]|uniref:ABC transporter ATP-binding protein n=1 Tax=unclassified Microbacterium TaxID=2609290 RepID=UPI00214BBB95|nr:MULTISPECIES: ABC transporter ATP-binding protein [unclassified Microbacterium]MCR2810635.1 ABC transporter ATP-binding protein [Microbacterium sp. zg.B185]WIM18172.1 ABC transporter ATP-binding protein [Microbacterium sp. zg-B185]